MEFATEHVSRLDAERNLRISINPTLLYDLGKENAHFFADSLSEYTRSLGEKFAAFSSQDYSLMGQAEIDKLAIDVQQAQARFISSLPEDIDRTVVSRIMTPVPLRTRTDLLLASLLTTAVGDFEVLFSEIVSFFYRLRPSALKAHDAQLSWAEIDSYGSLDELRTHFIDERVSQLMWKGFEEWMKWLNQQLKIQYAEIALDSSTTSEIFQRRHVIVHNGGVVSPQYVAKMADKPSGARLGERLIVEQSLSRLRY